MGETIFVTVMAVIAIGVGIVAWWGENHVSEDTNQGDTNQDDTNQNNINKV